MPINGHFGDFLTDLLSVAVGPQTRAYIGLLLTAMFLVCILSATLFKPVSPVDILKPVIFMTVENTNVADT